MVSDTYKDDKGYLRSIKDGELIHRKIAYKEYKRNRAKYSLPFKSYVIHHKNGNKLDNKLRNLEILTKEEHNALHLNRNKSYSDLTYTSSESHGDNSLLIGVGVFLLFFFGILGGDFFKYNPIFSFIGSVFTALCVVVVYRYYQ